MDVAIALRREGDKEFITVRRSADLGDLDTAVVGIEILRAVGEIRIIDIRRQNAGRNDGECFGDDRGVGNGDTGIRIGACRIAKSPAVAEIACRLTFAIIVLHGIAISVPVDVEITNRQDEGLRQGLGAGFRCRAVADLLIGQLDEHSIDLAFGLAHKTGRLQLGITLQLQRAACDLAVRFGLEETVVRVAPLIRRSDRCGRMGGDERSLRIVRTRGGERRMRKRLNGFGGIDECLDEAGTLRARCRFQRGNGRGEVTAGPYGCGVGCRISRQQRVIGGFNLATSSAMLPRSRAVRVSVTSLKVKFFAAMVFTASSAVW